MTNYEKSLFFAPTSIIFWGMWPRLQIHKVTVSFPSLFPAPFYPFLLMPCCSHAPRRGDECLNVSSFALHLPCNMLYPPGLTLLILGMCIQHSPACPYSSSHYLTLEWWWPPLSVSSPLRLSFFLSIHVIHSVRLIFLKYICNHDLLLLKNLL